MAGSSRAQPCAAHAPAPDAGGNPGGGFGSRAEAPDGKKSDDGVVDADFEEVKDDKKKRA